MLAVTAALAASPVTAGEVKPPGEDDVYSVPDEMIGLILPNDERVEMTPRGPVIRFRPG